MEDEVIGNAVGDSFLNKCYKGNKFFDALESFSISIFFWAQPYPLFLLLLIILIILPVMFSFCSQGSFLKIHRLYNAIRLGLLSLLHQIGYSYTIIIPLNIFIHQNSPCIQAKSQEKVVLGNFQFPYCGSTSLTCFLFTISHFSNFNRIKSTILITILLTIFIISVIAANDASLFQSVSSIFISYIIHFIHFYIPFKYVHFENAFVLLLNIATTLFCICYFKASPDSISYVMTFDFAIILIDEFMLIRHQVSRKTFSVERPVDITWNAETQHKESIKLLNNEEEEHFYDNLNADTLTSIISFIVFFVAILLRRSFNTDSYFFEYK